MSTLDAVLERARREHDSAVAFLKARKFGTKHHRVNTTSAAMEAVLELTRAILAIGEARA